MWVVLLIDLFCWCEYSFFFKFLFAIEVENQVFACAYKIYFVAGCFAAKVDSANFVDMKRFEGVLNLGKCLFKVEFCGKRGG